MLSPEKIQKARDAGYDDDTIVSSIERNDPEFAKRIKKAREAGYDSSIILDSIYRNHGKNEAEKRRTTTNNPAPQNSLSVSRSDNNRITTPQKNQETNEKSNVKPLYMENSVMERLDPVSQRLRESGYEPDVSDEFERLSQGGTREVLKTLLSLGHAGDPEVKENLGELAKGAASGATLGLSEYVPGLETKGGLASGIGEFLGETIPISGLSKLFVKPLVNIAKKSPKYKTALESFARLTGMTALGTAYGGAKDVVKTGEMPTREDLLKHGASWAALEAVLESLKLGGKFTNWIAKQPNKTKAINDLASKRVNEIESAIENVSKERITNKKPENVVKSKEQLIVDKKQVEESISTLSDGNKKKLAQKAYDRDFIRTPEQLDTFLDEYESAFPSIPGKTIRDKNRKFLNKYAQNNIETRKFNLSQDEAVFNIKPSPERQLEIGRQQIREAKFEKDKIKQKEAQKRIDLAKRKIEKQNQRNEKAEKNLLKKENKTKEVNTQNDSTPNDVKPLYNENAVLRKPEDIRIGEGGGKSTASLSVERNGAYFPEKIQLTKEEKKLVDASNAWEKAGDQAEASRYAQEAREMIYKRLKPKSESASINVKPAQLSVKKPKTPKKKPEPKPIVETTGQGAGERIEYIQDTLNSNVDRMNNAIQAVKSPKESLKALGSKANTAIFNFMAPLEKLESSIPVANRVSTRLKLAQNAASEVNSVLENGIFSNTTGQFEHHGLKGAYGDLTWKRLNKGLKQDQYSLKDLDTYRQSKIALRRQSQGKKTGVDTAQAKVDVERLKQKYGPIDQRIREYNKNVLSVYGKDLLGKDLINQWNKEYYAPLFRVMDSGTEPILRSGSLEPKQPFKAFKGSERKLIAASESDPYNTNMLISNAKKNDAVLQYKKLVEKGDLPGEIRKVERSKLPKEFKQELEGKMEMEIDPDIEPVVENLAEQTRKNSFTPRKNVLRCWENGQAYEIQVPEDVYNVFSSLAPQDRSSIAKLFAASNRLFSRGISLSPRKAVSIFARDALSSLVFSRTGSSPFSVVEALGDIYGNKKIYQEFLAMGGDVYASKLATRIDRAKKIEELITPGKSGPVVPLAKLGEWIRKYPEFTSNMSMAVPLAEYKRALKKYGNTAEGRLMAAMEARKVTYDPTRKGGSKITQELGNYIPFWNVSLQELSMLGNRLKDPSTYVKGIAAITIPTLALKMLNDQNPKYQELTPQDKAAYWHIFSGDKHFRVAIPWLLGTTFKVGPEAMFDIAQSQGGEAWEGLWNNFLDNLSGDIPPMLQSYVEWQTNKSLPSPLSTLLGGESTNAPIVPQRLQGLPNKYQYTSKTSQLARWFGDMWDISPVKLERLIKTNTGTLGAEGLALIDEIAYATGLAKDERPAQRESNFLLLGNWLTTSPTSYTKYAREFYRLREEHSKNKQAEKKGESYKDKNKFNVLETYNKQIATAFKQYRDIESRDISPVDKKRLLNEKQKEINKLYKKAVESVK